MRRWVWPLTQKTASFRNQTVTRNRYQKYTGLAQKVGYSRTKSDPLPIQQHGSIINPREDPYAPVASELSYLRGNLLGLLGSAHPGLSEISQYYFLHPSKQLRSLLVLLFARATNGLGRNWYNKQQAAQSEVDTGRSEELDLPLKLPDVLNNPHSSMPNDAASFGSVFELQHPTQPFPSPLSSVPSPIKSTIPRLASPPFLLPVQIRLAQIAEMIHIASLLHHDVLGPPPLDSRPSMGFGNKLSILGGDFLLGRASTALARLGDSEVVELMAGVISNIVEGEMLRIKGLQDPSPWQTERPNDDAWDFYLRKTYLKTASLMAKSARAAIVLGGCTDDEIWKDAAYAYGRNLGIAYQLVQDTLDYEAGVENIEPGFITGPALFAGEEYPELRPLIQRNFTNDGDIELAVDYVSRSTGIERTRLLAQSYADKARESLQILPDSEAKIALDILTDYAIKWTW